MSGGRSGRWGVQGNLYHSPLGYRGEARGGGQNTLPSPPLFPPAQSGPPFSPETTLLAGRTGMGAVGTNSSRNIYRRVLFLRQFRLFRPPACVGGGE